MCGKFHTKNLFYETKEGNKNACLLPNYTANESEIENTLLLK